MSKQLQTSKTFVLIVQTIAMETSETVIYWNNLQAQDRRIHSNLSTEDLNYCIPNDPQLIHSFIHLY